jgi:ATP-binding cassette subfamily F protein uup
MPPILQLKDATVRFDGPPLFEGLDASIARGERICLVGRNGSGKSTLMKALSGLIEVDHGERFVQPGVRVAYLPQEADFRTDMTVAAHVIAGLPDPRETHRADATISRLGLDPARSVLNLSGGEARRTALARALAGEPDVLLLDEPTNHLDLPTIEWLERTLAEYPGGLLVISHDRAFLARVASRVFWLDRGRLRVMDDSYARFEDWQEKILEEEAEQQLRLQRFIESETDWLRKSVRARRTRNEGRKRRLEQLRAQRAAFVGPQGRARLAAETEESRSRLIIEAEDLRLVLPQDAAGQRRVLVRNFSLRILRGDRIGIIGPNGAGKTTLIKALLGEIAPESGHVRVARTVSPASFDQKREALDPNKTLIDTLVPQGGDHVFVRGRPRHVIAHLRDFLFDDKQARNLVGSLSGGERNRLMLARTLAQRSNLLVLDEPTNDLDMDTLDMLIDMLDQYEGTLITVSHDRDFLDRLVNGLLVLRGDGTVEEVAGGYSDWLRQDRERGGDEPERTKPARAQRKPANEPADRLRLSWKEAKELEELPARIAALADQRAQITAELADPALYAGGPAAVAAKNQALRAAETELAAAEERWLELEAKREDLERARRERAGF